MEFLDNPFFWIVMISLYFQPSMIAMSRKHEAIWQVIMINSLLGWLPFVWLATFWWAIFGDKKVMAPHQVTSEGQS